MSLDLLEQTIQYTFYNQQDGKDNINSRVFKNVKKGASAAGLAKVGDVLASLQGTDLTAATLIQKQAIPLIDAVN
ncbi:DUF1659 domain-containing protein [Lactobacillus apis]|uniref:DUF1659 domain-containing protein n=1 Tax=Lactobacillus apis TaxID=303541 RepID=UPI00242A38D2|nr:DUF1659 domain-containing protein [Lactobacillus apis]